MTLTLASDEIQALDLLSKVFVRNWNHIVRLSFASVSDKVCKSVCVLDWSWHFDWARHVVVSVAQLECKHLNLLLRILDCIVDDVVMCWGHYSLSWLLTHQEEIISIWINNTWVDHSSWNRVTKSWWIFVVEESLRNSFVNQNHHHFDFFTGVVFKIFESLCDLRHLMSQNCGLLRLANSISIDDNFIRISSIASFECFQSITHDTFESICKFLTNISLNFACWPVFCSSWIDWSTKG